jgi:hypothetical protein
VARALRVNGSAQKHRTAQVRRSFAEGVDSALWREMRRGEPERRPIVR